MNKLSLFFPLFILALFSCGKSNDSKLTANLTALVENSSVVIQKIEGQKAGGNKIVYKSNIKKENITIKQKDVSLEFYIKGNSGNVEFIPGVVGFPDNWKKYKYLSLSSKNISDGNINIILKVNGVRNVIIDSLNLASDSKGEIKILIDELPLANKHENIYSPNSICIEAASLKKEFSLEISELALIERNSDLIEPVVDKFGQRIHGNWEGKITSEEELKQNLSDELAKLKITESEKLDEYGGLISDKSFPATGYFYVTQENDNWWFVTPEGNKFWSFGVTCLRPKYPMTACTPSLKKEGLYEEIPSKDGRFKDAWTSDTNVSFYYANAIRKYDSIQAWRDMTFKRLKNWGYNSIGNWSENKLLNQSKIPFTYSFRTNTKEELRLPNGLCDVFDPKWESFVDSTLNGATHFKDNSCLIGYFVDNEAGWGRLNLLADLPENATGRAVWQNMLQDKYLNINKLNNSWGTDFKNWNEVANLEDDKFSQAPAFKADLIDFEGLFAEKYFRTIKETLKKYDSNHLYLGCRFTRRIKPKHICEAAGKYCDVVTVNVYAWAPTREIMGNWYEYTKRPILIGEHHIHLKSERQFEPTYGALSEEERYNYYMKYVEAWANLPYSLGCHWYQYTDQHITGRASNGENQVIGLVDITDQPHEELVSAIKVLSGKIYEWHNK